MPKTNTDKTGDTYCKMTEITPIEIFKLVILFLLCLAVTKLIFWTIGISGARLRTDIARRSKSIPNDPATNWVTCRICRTPFTTDSYDINTWFCNSCEQQRNEVFDANNPNPTPSESSIIKWNKDGSMKV